MHDHIVFRVSENLTYSNIDDFIKRFEKTVEAKGIKRTIIDTRSIKVFDSTVLAALVHQHKKLLPADGYICLVHVSKLLMETLQATKLDQVILPFESVDDVLDYMSNYGGTMPSPAPETNS